MEHDDDHTSGQESSPLGQGGRSPGQSGSESTGDVPVELRTSSAATIGWVAIGAAVLVAVLIVLQVPATAAVSMLGLPAFIAVVAWACYLRPRTILHPEGMLVVNILRTYYVPFARIVNIDSRLGVTLETDSGQRIGVWSLPNSGRRARREGLSRAVAEQHAPAEDEQHTPSEVEQLHVAQRLWLNSDSAASARGAEIVTQIRALPTALCALTAAWALWGLRFSATL